MTLSRSGQRKESGREAQMPTISRAEIQKICGFPLVVSQERHET